MAYDRYIAICKPLHYGTIMDSRTCVNMAAAAWGSTFLYAVLHTANTFSIPLCQGNAVDQFFCELPEILKLSCSDAYLREVGLLVVSACLASGCFVFLVVSYVQIFRVVLRMPSEQGRHKAFSMCLPHLAVVSLMVSTGIFCYLKPPSMSSSSLNLLLAVLYSVVPPAVNPLIYSMRNQELKNAANTSHEDRFSMNTLTDEDISRKFVGRQNFSEASSSSAEISPDETTRTRRNGHKMEHRKFCTNTRKNFFTVRVMEYWNRLPREVVEFPSLEIFKARLDAYLCNLL
ncbi:olfactory receptor 14A16-like [Anser cygnoides]|uniref:olfactory receptor 14A16-like n=1 Tax=Anser cygnoides TaxID=8845 RepID=UPI0034D3867E